MQGALSTQSPVAERVVVTRNKEAAAVVRLLRFLESFPVASSEGLWEALAELELEGLVAWIPNRRLLSMIVYRLRVHIVKDSGRRLLAEADTPLRRLLMMN